MYAFIIEKIKERFQIRVISRKLFRKIYDYVKKRILIINLDKIQKQEFQV